MRKVKRKGRMVIMNEQVSGSLKHSGAANGYAAGHSWRMTV